MENKKAPDRLVRVRFRLDRAEYVRGVRYYLRKSYLVSWVQLVIVLAVLGAVLGLTWAMGRLNFLNTLILVLLLLVSGYGGFLYLLQPGRYYDRHPELGKEVTYVFSREDLSRQDDKAAAIYDWNVKKLWRGRAFYYLFTGEEGYTMLPYRAFQSESDRETFEELVVDANRDLKVRNCG